MFDKIFSLLIALLSSSVLVTLITKYFESKNFSSELLIKNEMYKLNNFFIQFDQKLQPFLFPSENRKSLKKKTETSNLELLSILEEMESKIKNDTTLYLAMGSRFKQSLSNLLTVGNNQNMSKQKQVKNLYKRTSIFSIYYNSELNYCKKICGYSSTSLSSKMYLRYPIKSIYLKLEDLMITGMAIVGFIYAIFTILFIVVSFFLIIAVLQ